MDLGGHDLYEQHHSIDTLPLAASLKNPYFKTDKRQSRSLPSFRSLFLLLNLFVITLNIAFYSLTWSKASTIEDYCPEPPYCKLSRYNTWPNNLIYKALAPATTSLRYHERVLDPYASSPYGGNVSSPEMNAAWQSLKISQSVLIS